MNNRSLLNALLTTGLALATSVPAQASDFALPPLQRSECSAAGGWDRSATTVLQCAGDVLLAGGTWESESAIVVRAEGLLWLSDARFTAPGIELQGTSIRFDDDVYLDLTGGTINLATTGADGTVSVGGTVVARAGGQLDILPGGSVVLSAVPEPETLWMWLAGLAVLAGRWRRIATAGARSIPA